MTKLDFLRRSEIDAEYKRSQEVVLTVFNRSENGLYVSKEQFRIALIALERIEEIDKSEILSSEATRRSRIDRASKAVIAAAFTAALLQSSATGATAQEVRHPYQVVAPAEVQTVSPSSSISKHARELIKSDGANIETQNLRTAIVNSVAKLTDGVKPNLARFEIVPADKQMPGALEAAGYKVNDISLRDCKMNLGAVIVDSGADRGWWAAGTPNDPDHGNMNTHALYAWVKAHEKDGISDVGGTAKYQVLHDVTSVEQLIPGDILLSEGHVAIFTGGIIDPDGNINTGAEAASISQRKFGPVNGKNMLQWFIKYKPGFVVLRIMAPSASGAQDTSLPVFPQKRSSSASDTIAISGDSNNTSNPSETITIQGGATKTVSQNIAEELTKDPELSLGAGNGTLTITDTNTTSSSVKTGGITKSSVETQFPDSAVDGNTFNGGNVTIVDLGPSGTSNVLSPVPVSDYRDGPDISNLMPAVNKEAQKNRLANIRYDLESSRPFEEGKLYHRSGRVPYAFENSPEGIKYAIKHGYDRIDLDLQVTNDGVVVVTHTRDPLRRGKVFGGFKDTSGKITNRKIEISEMTFEQVKRLKHAKGYTIHSLEELIKVADNKITLFLELKTPETLIHKLPEITEMLNNAKQKATIGGIIKHGGKKVEGQEAALEAAQKLGFWVRKLYLGAQKNTWHRPLPATSSSEQVDDN